MNHSSWRKYSRIWAILLIFFFIVSPFASSEAAVLKNTYPRLSNYFLSWDLSDEQAVELAKWDLVILDMEHQIKNRDKILKMRQLNPQIIILAYLTIQEMRSDVMWLKDYLPLRYQLYQGIKSEWWLKNPEGREISWWPQTRMLNITAQAPVDSAGQRWNDYLSLFISQEILGSGLWDGMFFDNTWNSLTQKVGSNLDINGDGQVESGSLIEDSYQRGMNYFFNRVRELTANHYLLMGNDGDSFTLLNGMQFENFPWGRGWSQMMRDFSSYPLKAASPAFSAINANTANAGGRDDYKKMRFGLASALLANGFYSFDLGDQNHGQTWWYDEYDFSLGEAAGAAFLVSGQSASLIDFKRRGLWRRDFKQGLVLANSGPGDETIELNGEYEKLKGEQDPGVNNGLIVSNVTMPTQDGLILLRPIDQLMGSPFRNGSFARILNEKGQSIRNGFFAYNNQFKGGQTLLMADLDNDSEREIILTKGNLINIYKDQILWQSFPPFDTSFKGEITVALADLNQDEQLELIVGQNSKGSEVRIYDLSGHKKGKAFNAFPKWYRGGVNLAVGDLNGNGQFEIVIGAATGRAQVRIFSQRGRLVSGGFYAYGRSFLGGVNVAVGDINGDGRAEIVTGPTRGAPEIKIFNSQAKQVGKSFFGASPRDKNGIGVAVVDVDENGVGEIISLSQEVFTTAFK